MDLVVHIGLPKTATTTLQKHLFVRCDGYVGRFVNSKEGHDMGKRLPEIMEAANAKRRSGKGITDWCDEAWAAGWRAKASKVVVSAEGISGVGASQRGGILGWEPDKVADAISRLRDAWSKYGRMHALMTIRKQSDFFISHYVQHSNRFLRAGGEHFERWVAELLERRPENVDWGRWHAQISSAVGQGGVAVLPMEGMGEQRYWEELSKLCEPSLPKVWSCGAHENRKRVEQGRQWKVRAFNFKAFALDGEMRLRRSDSKSYKVNRRVIKWVAKPVNLSLALLGPMVRDSQVKLREDLEAAILSHCKVANQNLAEKIEWDLGSLGYW